MAYLSSSGFGPSSSLVEYILTDALGYCGSQNQFDNWHKVAGLVSVALVSCECRSQTIMNQSQLTLSIYQNLENLFNTNQSLYDYWVSELYDEEGDPIHEMWNEDTLNEMEADVQKQIELVS